MPSWQSHVMRLAQYGFRFFSGRLTGLDVAQERREAAFAERLLKALSSIQYSATTANGVPMEWAAPAGLFTERAIIYVHGGAFYSGTLSGACLVAWNISLAARARVLTIEYRLTPEHPFPAALGAMRRV